MKYGASRRGVTAKYVAVAWIVFLEVIVALYLYSNPVGGESQNPFVPSTSAAITTSKTTKTTTTTTSSKPSDKIEVESALIVNSTLTMKVHNLGPSATNLLAVTNVCSPGFQTCSTYKSLTGAKYQRPFNLPAGRTFNENLTGVCTVPISGCKNYFPVANATYYLKITFSFTDGNAALVPISVMANNTYPPFPHETAILNITSPSLVVTPANLTGLLNVTLGLNSSQPYAQWTTLLNGYSSTSKSFSQNLLINKTGGCVGTEVDNATDDGVPLDQVISARGYTADCSQPLAAAQSFSTVFVNIVPGSYYLLAIRDLTDVDQPSGYVNYDGPNHTFGWESFFALWIKCTAPTTPSSTSTVTSTSSSTITSTSTSTSTVIVTTHVPPTTITTGTTATQTVVKTTTATTTSTFTTTTGLHS